MALKLNVLKDANCGIFVNDSFKYFMYEDENFFLLWIFSHCMCFFSLSLMLPRSSVKGPESNSTS